MLDSWQVRTRRRPCSLPRSSACCPPIRRSSASSKWPPTAWAYLLRSHGDDLAVSHPAEARALIESTLEGWNLANVAGHVSKEIVEDDPAAGMAFTLAAQVGEIVEKLEQ